MSYLTSCHATFLHWKIILKIIVYNASNSSNHLVHSSQLRHLPPLDTPSPPNSRSHTATEPTHLPTTESCPPLLFQNASSAPCPPLYRFSTWFPSNSEANSMKIHRFRWTHPLPTPFLPTLWPIKCIERDAIPHRTPFCMCPPNEHCRPPPFISAS
jgi:hypothetical protein